MNKATLFILEHNPSLEIVIRRFLWRFTGIKEFINEHFSLSVGSKKNEVNPKLWEQVKEQIRNYNIQKGDILLVHSSMDGLVKTGVSAKEVIDFLLELLGEEGTLVFAAYPKCKPYKDDETVLYYDPKKTISWTGMLPNVFCRYPGVERSPFPYNSLAAKGPHAKAMMEHNLLDDTSQAEHSAWKYCVDHHAKMLFLGVSAALSCTMMNYPEDALGEEWYVKDWYDEKKYAIKQGDNILFKTIRERNLKWYQFYAMFHSEYWMLQHGFLEKAILDDVYVGYTADMYTLAEELLRLGRQKKSVYRIPKKYWKE